MTTAASDNTNLSIDREGLSFFGVISASVSHELNNVISIIDQTNGLLADLLVGTTHGAEIKTEQLQRIAERIDNQTARGVRIIKRLSMFAHSVDELEKEFDINELVENITALSRRFANLQKIELSLELAEEPIMIINNPFLVQHLLFLVIQEATQVGLKGDAVSMCLNNNDDGVELTIEVPKRQASLETAAGSLREALLSQIQGKLSVEESSGCLQIRIFIPFKR